MRLRAPIVAAVLLGSAVALVWLVRKEPQTVESETSAASVDVRDADDAGRPADETPPSFSAASQERTADNAAHTDPEPPRSPLPGDALTTPLTQLMEDQRALNLGRAPFGIDEGFPQLAHSERAFAAEPIDESWARGQQTEILSEISQLQGLALLDLRVECRSTMCRVQMSQPRGDGAPAFRDVAKAIGMEPQWVMSLAGPGGSLNTVGYLWRDGYAPARPGLRTIVGDPEQAP